MWDLYDTLIEGIPKEPEVEEVITGHTWTLVLASGGLMGYSMTTEGTSRMQILPQVIKGMKLYEAAAAVKSWNMRDAAIGMAAINAWYNSGCRMRELNAAQGNTDYCTFGIPLKGRTVGMVGHLRKPDNLFDEVKELYILERNVHPGDYPDTACEFLLPQCDLVIITGSAFINKTMPRLLELSHNSEVLVTGPSVPMNPALLKYGINRLTGLILTHRDQAAEFVKNAPPQSPYGLGERFVLDSFCDNNGI